MDKITFKLKKYKSVDMRVGVNCPFIILKNHLYFYCNNVRIRKVRNYLFKYLHSIEKYINTTKS